MSGTFGTPVPALVGDERITLNGGGRANATTQEIANLGTNAPSSPTITGGTIDNAIIGGSTPAAGHFTTLGVTGAVTLNPANANVSIAPSGTGTHAINNMTVGVTTPLAGKFTTASVTTDNGVVMTNQTSDAGAQTATMTNGPTAGDPLFWLRISINGTNVAIPAWTAV